MESVNYHILLSEHGAGFDFIYHSKPKDMNKNFILKTDILDIIFEKRNKLYGAYNLRKFYPNRLKIALGLMFVLAAIFSGFTLMPSKTKNIVSPVYTAPEPILRDVDITPKEEPKKPQVKKPEVIKADPKPVVASQTKYLSNIAIVDKGKKADSIVTLQPTVAIGNENIVAPTPGPFLVQPLKTEPAGGGEKPATVIDKTIPMNGDAVEVLPSYPGGMDALKKFLEKNLQNPGEMEQGESVSVKVRFVVDYSGKLKSFVTVLDGGEVYNKEVVRVLKRMPDWIPGKTKGENVSVYYVIPVKFTGAD